MNAMTAAALDNAKIRVQVGWPLLILALGLYAPAQALTRMVLLAAAVLLLVRAVPVVEAGPKKRPAPVAGRAPKSRKTIPSSKTTTSSKDPIMTVPRQRGANGRWSK